MPKPPISRIVLCALCLAVLSHTCSGAPHYNPTDTHVIAAAISHEYRQDKRQIILEDRTVALDADWIQKMLWQVRNGLTGPAVEGQPAPKPNQAVFEDLQARNRKAVSLTGLKLGKRVVVVSYREVERIFRHGWWPAFHKRFPSSTGLTRVSMPGYSGDRTQAVIQLSNGRDGKWGHGVLYNLAKEKGQWRVTGALGLWRA